MFSSSHWKKIRAAPARRLRHAPRVAFASAHTYMLYHVRSRLATVRRFSSLVSASLADQLRKIRVYEPNGVQREAISKALLSEDVLCVAQTGSGKTMCFLLPLLERLSASTSSPNIGLILAPTRELVMQHAGIAEELAAALPNSPEVKVISKGTTSPMTSVASRAAGTSPVLLVAQPDDALARLRDGTLDASSLLAVALDEVDAILCGGPFEETISPEGAELLDAVGLVGTDTLNGAAGKDSNAAPASPQCLLTTAHLTQAHDAALRATFPAAARVQQRAASGRTAGALVPSLRQIFHYTASHNKDAKLVSVLARAQNDPWLSGGAALIFTSSAASVERLSAVVSQSRPQARFAPLVLHEELDDCTRADAFSALRAAARESSDGAPMEPRILIATGVAARGLDVANLRHVVLYDMPEDVAGYIHCAGRTARRGRNGLVSCLVESQQQAGRFRQLHALTAAPRLNFAGS